MKTTTPKTNGHAAAPAGEYLPAVPIASIRPWPGNPRKTFHEDSLKELAESLKSKGCLQPLLVRPRALTAPRNRAGTLDDLMGYEIADAAAQHDAERGAGWRHPGPSLLPSCLRARYHVPMPNRPAIHRPPGQAQQQRAVYHDRRQQPQQKALSTQSYRRFRLAKLAETPLCQDCQAKGIVTAGVEIHHCRGLAQHPEDLCDGDRVLVLCKPCHSARTAKGE